MSVAAGSTLIPPLAANDHGNAQMAYVKQSYPAKLGQAAIARALKSGR